MALATRPPNLIRRVLDPAGSLGGEPLGWMVALVTVCGIAGGLLLANIKSHLGFAPILFGFIATAQCRANFARKLHIEIDDSGPRWFSWTLVTIVLGVFISLLFLGTEAANPIACGLFGSVLPFSFVVSTRQISQQAAKRPS